MLRSALIVVPLLLIGSTLADARVSGKRVRVNGMQMSLFEAGAP